MYTRGKAYKRLCALGLVIGVLACTTASAWHGGGGGYHGGGGGSYYHGGGGGYYHGGGWGGPAIVVGVPFGGYYGPAYYGPDYYAPTCRIVQECYPNQPCIRTQVCE